MLIKQSLNEIAMDEHKDLIQTFSLLNAGPFHRLLVRLRMDQKQWKAGLFFISITWMPLIILTAIDGTLYGVRASFLSDIPMQVRLLVALPILLLIGNTIENKITIVVDYLSKTVMNVAAREKDLPAILRWARKWTNSAWPEILLLVGILLTLFFIKGGFYGGLGTEPSSWKGSFNEDDQSLSLAGKWAVFISIPVFQFILYRWLWKYVVWIMLLFRISRMKLALQPVHPDHAGGLGIIALAQIYFILIFIAASTVISGELIEQLLKHPDFFQEIQNIGYGYIGLSLFLLIFPLVFFTDKLMDAKHQGEINHSHLGMVMSRQFENDWVNQKTIEERVKELHIDPSSLNDYSQVYKGLENLRFVPVTLREVISMTLLLLIPYVPIALIHFPIIELLQKIIGLLGVH